MSKTAEALEWFWGAVGALIFGTALYIGGDAVHRHVKAAREAERARAPSAEQEGECHDAVSNGEAELPERTVGTAAKPKDRRSAARVRVRSVQTVARHQQ